MAMRAMMKELKEASMMMAQAENSMMKRAIPKPKE